MGQRWYEDQQAPRRQKRKPTAESFGTVGKKLSQGGFVVIPVKGKQPVPKGWSGFWQRPPSEATYSKWYKTNADENVGVCTGEVVAIDIDHNNPASAEEAQALVFSILGPTHFIRVGRAPRRTLFYKLPYIEARQTSSWSKGCVDLLADGKQSVVFGIHPDTGEPFRWPQRSILGAAVHELPLTNITALQQLRETLRDADNETDPIEISIDREPSVGERNDFLFRFARDSAHSASSKTELLDKLGTRNASFPAPLTSDEVRSITNSVWRYKEEGRLFVSGTEAPVVLPVTRDRGSELFKKLSPAASKLYLILASTRDNREEFRIAQRATAEFMGCGVQTVSNAIKELIATRLLIDLEKTRGGSSNWRGAKLYRFGSGMATRECLVSSVLP